MKNKKETEGNPPNHYLDKQTYIANEEYTCTCNWGERERAPPLMMSTALVSVRPRTSRRLRMRDIHVIYAAISRDTCICGFEFC